MERAYPRKEAPPRAALGFRRFRGTVVEVPRGRGWLSPTLFARRTVHRCRRGDRLRFALGYDVQVAAGATGVQFVRRALK